MIENNIKQQNNRIEIT